MISSLVRIAVGLSCEKKNALEALNDGARVGQIRGKLVAHASPAERDWRRGPRGANENSGALPGVAVDGTCPMADGELRAFDALASHAKLAELVAITRTLANASTELWDAIADRIRRVDQGKLPALSRGEAMIGCAALAASSSKGAQKHVHQLSAELKDRALARVLGKHAAVQIDERILGELGIVPRGPFVTALLALSVLLFVIHGARLVARLALAFKQPAEVTLSDAG